MLGQMVVSALAAAGVIACCSTVPGATPSKPGCCVEMTARIDKRFTDAERLAIEDAFTAWRESTNGKACISETTGERFHVAIVRASSAQDFAPFSSDPDRLLGFYRGGLITLRMDQTTQDKWATLVVHELGHLLNMQHRDDDPTSVMHSILTAAMPGGRVPRSDVVAFLEQNHCH